MKKSLFRAGIAAVLGCALLGSMTACGDGDSDNTITFYYYSMTSKLTAQLQEKLADFTEQTGITVKPIPINKESYNATISTKIGGRKKDIDILYLDQPLLAQYASSGLLYKLDDYITEGSGETETVADGESFKFDRNAFNDSAWQTTMYNDSCYAVPLTMNTSVFYYNTATIKAALGLGTDAEAVAAVEAVKTWDDLKALAERVSGLGSTYALFGGMSNGGYMGWYSQCFVAAAGGTMYDAETKTVLPDEEATKSAFEMIKYMYDKSPSALYNSSTGFRGTAASPAGKVLFNLADSSAIKDLNVSYTTFGAIPVPGKTEAIGSKSNIGGENIVITSKSDKKDKALKFMEYLVSEDCAPMFQECTHNYSAIDKYANIETFSTDPSSSVYKMYSVLKDSLENAQVRPVVSGWMQVNDNGIPSGLNKYIDGESTFEQALASIRAFAGQHLK